MNINHYLYPKDYDPSTNTFLFNTHILDQYVHFHSIGTLSVNKHFFFFFLKWSINTFPFNKHLLGQ